MAKDDNSVAGPDMGLSTGKSIKEIGMKVLAGAMDNPQLLQGLANISKAPPLDLEAQTPSPSKGKPFSPAVMHMMHYKNKNHIVLAAEGMVPMYIPLAKFASMIECAHDEKSPAIVVQNPQTPTDRQEGQGQILGRFYPAHAELTFARGNQAVPIRDESDILRKDNFQIDPSTLAAYYLVCRYQIMGENRLKDLIARFEGVRYFEL